MAPIQPVKMKADEQQLKYVLEMLAGGATCDYQPVRGGVLVLDSAKSIDEGVAVEVFFELRERGLISQTDKLEQWHPIFHPSFQNPIYRYDITEQGKVYLGSKPSQ